MKINNTELLAQLTEITAGLTFPWSDSDNPIHPFFWDIQNQGEFSIEALLRSETPNFYSYTEGGQIMKTVNIDNYLELFCQQGEEHQQVIEILKSGTVLLEAAQIRTLDDPADSFKIIFGLTKSGEWIGISPEIPADFQEWNANGEYTVGNPLLPIYQSQSSENIELLVKLEPLLPELKFCERQLIDRQVESGFIVRIGINRELMLNQLLDAIGFARTFSFPQFTPPEIDEDDDQIPALEELDNILESNLSNLRTYLLGIGCCYTIYVIGETEDGNLAGVSSMAVWS